MSKKTKPSPEELLKVFLSIHVPKEYLTFFELDGVKDKPDCWELILVEKPDFIPK